MPTVPPPVSRAPVSGTPWVPRADGALVRAILKHTPRSPTSFASRTRPAEAPVPPRTPDATWPHSTTPRFSLTGFSDPGCPCVSAMYPSPPCSTLTRHVVRLHLQQQSAGTAASPRPVSSEYTLSCVPRSSQTAKPLNNGCAQACNRSPAVASRPDSDGETFSKLHQNAMPPARYTHKNKHTRTTTSFTLPACCSAKAECSG